MLLIRFAQFVFLAAAFGGIVFLVWRRYLDVRFFQIEKLRLGRAASAPAGENARSALMRIFQPTALRLFDAEETVGLQESRLPAAGIIRSMKEHALFACAVPDPGVRFSGSGRAFLHLGAGDRDQIWILDFSQNLPRPETVEQVRRILGARFREQQNQTASTLESTALAELAMAEKRGMSLAVQRIAHDIRIPVASLALIRENLAAEWSRIKESAPSLHMDGLLLRLNRQTANLELFVSAFLDLERGFSQEVSERVDLGSLLLSLLDGHSEEFKQKSQRLKIAGAEPGVLVFASKGSLVRILENLLANAMKFAGQNGTIFLSLSAEEESVRLALEDSGPGLGDGDVFEMARRNLGRSGGGYGIGLAAARELARGMNGDLRTEQPRHGSGARFLLVLPAAS